MSGRRRRGAEEQRGGGEGVNVSGKVYYPPVAQVFECVLENLLVEVV